MIDIQKCLKNEATGTLIVEKEIQNQQGLSLLNHLLLNFPSVQGILVAQNWSVEELLSVIHTRKNILCYTPEILSQKLATALQIRAAESFFHQKAPSVQANTPQTELQLRNLQFEELYQLCFMQQKKLDTLVNNSPAVMFALDPTGRFIFAEGQSLEDFGNPSELLGHSIYTSPPPYTVLIPHFEKALHGESCQFTFIGQGVYLETRLYPVYNQEQKIESVSGICLDITAQKQTELRLEQALKQAEEASKAKTAYLANMSHEIRTPLNAILGFAQILKRQTHLQENQQAHLQGIILGGEHLLKLINNVLELAKIEANKFKLHPTFFDIRQFLYNLETLYKPQFEEKGLCFELQIDSHVTTLIRTDEAALRQIAVNLLGNALKFTSTGQVYLRVKQLTDADSSVPTRLHLQVEDTGIGISPHAIQDIFDAFQQSRGGEQAKDSTGLGLAIAQRLVHLMKGQLTAQSVPGKGSCFTLELPVVCSEQRGVSIQEPPGEILQLAPHQPGYRILVVDDQSTNRQILSELLEMVGFQVKTVAEGRQALEVFQQWLPAAVLVDRRMPGMDGLEVTRKIRQMPGGTQTRIIMISASVFVEELEDVYTEQIDAFLSKPFHPEQVYRLLGEHLGLEYTTTTSDTPQKSQEDPPLSSFLPALHALPPVFISDLHHAVLTSDLDDMLTLIAHIDCKRTQDTLKKWVNAFEYEKLIELIEMGQNTACSEK